jgi:hypothetical protein
MYIYQKTSVETPSDFLCEQCKTKDKNGNCQIEETETTDPADQLRRVVTIQ